MINFEVIFDKFNVRRNHTYKFNRKWTNKRKNSKNRLQTNLWSCRSIGRKMGFGSLSYVRKQETERRFSMKGTNQDLFPLGSLYFNHRCIICGQKKAEILRVVG
jgi:hypothetical protein